MNVWMQEVLKNWTDKNPLGFNETLLTMKAYATYHHLYAISLIFSVGNSMHDRVPLPSATLDAAKNNSMIDQIVKISGRCLNTALRVALQRSLPKGAIFSPQNWKKSKQSLNDITASIEQHFDMLPTMDGGEQQYKRLMDAISVGQEVFEYRLQAD